MTIEQLRAVHHERPFHPFTIHLADGRSYDVPHPDFLSFAPSGRMVFVSRPDDSVGIVDVLLVTDLVIHPTVSANGPPS